MRRCSAKGRRQARRRGFCLLAVFVLTAGVLSLNRYVNTVVKPTLHELAEYEARSAAVQAMNRAVAAELTRSPALCDALFTQGSGLVSMDAAAAGAAGAAQACTSSARSSIPVSSHALRMEAIVFLTMFLSF